MKICVVGLGYMGLPSALLLVQAGHKVLGFDIVKEKIDKINAGIVPFKEPGLDELFHKNRHSLSVTNVLNHENVHDVNAYLVAVPTPVNEDHSCGLQYVEAAMRSLAPLLKPGVLVILESTVRPRTLTDVVIPILETSGLKAGKDFSVSFVAEKAIPGNTLYEAVHNDRVIGGIDERSNEITKQIYASFVKGELMVTDSTTAETVKLVENAFRDVNIAFANDLVRICEDLGIDVWKVIELANHHPRVKVLSPGPGVGGHCIAIDPWFLTEKTKSRMIENARNVNDSMPEYVFSRIKRIADMHGFKHPTIGILGVAYKKNVDDARDTPALGVIHACKRQGWNVLVHDPLVERFDVSLHDIDEVLKADILAIITDHDFYKGLDLSQKIILDTRHMPIRAKEYHLLGRGE